MCTRNQTFALPLPSSYQLIKLQCNHLPKLTDRCFATLVMHMPFTCNRLGANNFKCAGNALDTFIWNCPEPCRVCTPLNLVDYLRRISISSYHGNQGISLPRVEKPKEIVGTRIDFWKEQPSTNRSQLGRSTGKTQYLGTTMTVPFTEYTMVTRILQVKHFPFYRQCPRQEQSNIDKVPVSSFHSRPPYH